MGILHVVGLGPGDIQGLPMGSYQLLQRGLPIVLRTSIHPIVADLQEMGIPFTSFDDIYETSEAFDEVYQRMATRLQAQAAHCAEMIYAVPGHPLVAEQSVQHLLRSPVPGVDVRIGPGQSFLDVAAATLRIDPIEGLLLLDGTILAGRQLNPTVHTLIAQVYQRSIAADVKLTLMELYPDDYPITVLRAAAVIGQERVETIPLFELDRIDWVDHLTTLYIPPATTRLLRYRDLWEAVDIVAKLRGPGGCPWDRKQTHESLRSYVIEEAFEVAEAIDEGDFDHLCEELGDLVLQVLLHAQIGEEFGDFTLRDVFARLSEKLIRRHPHVFGNASATTPESVALLWDAAKAKERRNENHESIMDRVSLAGPALSVATDVQRAAAKVGFDWKQIKDVLEKTKEEMNELEVEILNGAGLPAISEELGDLFFACVNVSRYLDLDAEALLIAATRKFIARFAVVEKGIEQGGLEWTAYSPEQLNEMWDYAKITLKHKN